MVNVDEKYQSLERIVDNLFDASLVFYILLDILKDYHFI